MKALALALIAFCFCGRAWAGGTIGGVPPSIMVELVEFEKIAGDAIRGDVVVGDELMQPETLDFKERMMVLRSRVDPLKFVVIKVNSDKESSP